MIQSQLVCSIWQGDVITKAGCIGFARVFLLPGITVNTVANIPTILSALWLVPAAGGIVLAWRSKSITPATQMERG